MLHAFTRNYKDNSSDAGFQFTFNCDNCNDGYKSNFVQSTTKKKASLMKGLGTAASIGGSLLGGSARNIGYAAERGTGALSQNFQGQSPEWRKEHEKAFEKAQNEAKHHFKRCPHCNKYVCDHCWNEDAGLCVSCAPRQEVYVAQAAGQAMKRNVDAAAGSAIVWQGNIEAKTTICPSCGKPAGIGKFCNNCGASMELKECVKCGAKNALTVRFCNNCGENLAASAAPAPNAPSGKCSACGFENAPGTKFCGECGGKL